MKGLSRVSSFEADFLVSILRTTRRALGGGEGVVDAVRVEVRGDRVDVRTEWCMGSVERELCIEGMGSLL